MNRRLEDWKLFSRYRDAIARVSVFLHGICRSQRGREHTTPRSRFDTHVVSADVIVPTGTSPVGTRLSTVVDIGCYQRDFKRA